MPVIGSLDLGPSNPWKLPKSGIHTSVVEIPGGYAIPYAVDNTHPSWRLVFKYQARNSVGQYAALSQNAMEQLGRQLEELSRNPDQQPVYIQLFAGTGLSGGAIAQPQDGFYYITSCEVNYTEPFTGVGTVTMDVEYVSPGPPRRIGMWTSGGALSSNYSGPGINWAAFPLNTTGIGTSTTRTGGEGAVQILTNPLSPQPFVLSSTIADWFKGGCHVYDAMAGIGTNAVPAAPTFLNTNWVEVFGIDHRFVGDAVITNGLHLVTLSAAVQPGVVCYLWNTALGTPGWQQYAKLEYADSSSNSGTLQGYSLTRVGLEEIALQLTTLTSTSNFGKQTLRLQRGSYAIRLDFDPLSQANTVDLGEYLLFPANPKIEYNSGGMVDNGLSAQAQLGPQTDYGYGAAFIANNTYPFLAGFLYQNQPAHQASYQNAAYMGLGDTSGPAQNATRSYGIFAIPFGVVQNYQSEGESGAFGSGWSSVVDAAASAGNTAKCASGTLTANTNTFGTAFSPPSGSYDLWFRVKVTSNAGGSSEMQLGLWDPTALAFVASFTYKPSDVTTSYVFRRVAAAISLPAAHATQFRATTVATIGTDWFVDEAVLVPTTSSVSPYFPQDLFQQWLNDRTAKQVVD